ncbi:alpha/beta fold hydrolase [Methylobacterium platani]|uniref:Alpha/beta hydrolase n=2 Tax=Methylobacterium platani TaxID=427683 RepID=A0A179S984_9HYPH|nr:alpha/beta hydrolase [Methylobacterium platani]KMO15804.1 alpha/beta hydrolase [Methylobacterium platani JCM 14648]OAS23113.1 alpha/beta hydrolase [Methylobacterium platani]
MTFRFVPGRTTRRAASGAVRILRATAKATAKATATATANAAAARRTGALMREGAEALKPDAPAPAPPGRFVEVDGIRVHAIVRGRGRPVVLIHGNGTMAEDFVICGLVEQLARSYRVIAIDRPGFGHTERPRHRIWTAAAQARLVAHVLAALKVERPVVVGHSWGTLVALALALRDDPDSALDLRGLVLLSGYYYPGRRADVAMIAPLAVPGLGDAARALVPGAVGRALAPQVFRHVFSPQPVPARFTARFPVALSLSATQGRASAEDTASMNAAVALMQGRYAALRLPVAILSGDADAVVSPQEQSCRLHAAVAGSTLTLLPGQGHMIHYSAKARILRAIGAQMALTGRTLSWHSR